MYCPIPDSGFERIARKLFATLEDDVVEFFEENPNPSDDDLHSWAEDKGYDPHEIEEVVYTLATSYVQGEESDEDDSEDDDPEDDEETHEDQISGGKADEKQPKDYDLDQLLKGIEVEFEHTDDPEVAVEIAMDHLEEIDNYYDDLAEMEDKAKKKESRKRAQSDSGYSSFFNQLSDWVSEQGYELVDDPEEGDPHYGKDEIVFPTNDDSIFLSVYGNKKDPMVHLILSKGWRDKLAQVEIPIDSGIWESVIQRTVGY